MFGRGRPPLVAQVPISGVEDDRAGSLDRSGLDALLALWSKLGPGVVLVTGHEERSELAVGMAAAAAAAGRKAALLECDFANPGLAAKLGLDPEPGFSEYLADEAEAPEILQAVILAGPASSLAAAPLVCIAAGSPTGLGPMLLSSESFGHAIERLRAAYDVVVIDGPALDDPSSLRAAAPRADRVLASCARSRVPLRLRRVVDGIVETSA